MNPWFWSELCNDLIGKMQNLIEIFFIKMHESKALNKFKTQHNIFKDKYIMHGLLLKKSGRPCIHKLKATSASISTKWNWTFLKVAADQSTRDLYAVRTCAFLWQASASTFSVEFFWYHSLYAYLFCCFSFYKFHLVMSVHFLLIPMHKTMKSTRICVQVCVVCIWLNSIG